MDRKKILRSGYTTGACAAAAAKAAAMVLLGVYPKDNKVEIPFPDGSRVKFELTDCHISGGVATAIVVKDAGDDPDVTNGAEIMAIATFNHEHETGIFIKGGEGVGTVTRPGLPVAIGEPAINPVPRSMITKAVTEAVVESGKDSAVDVEIAVPDGQRLAKSTLNERLGIIGGISILGTTGVVRPLSSAAWTATIESSMKVAEAMGEKIVLLSSGRTSELAGIKKFNLPEHACVMMGDYVKFSFKATGEHDFRQVYLVAQWAKMLKIAMGTPDTHVRAGAIDMDVTVKFLKGLGISIPDKQYNTAREMLTYIKKDSDVKKVLREAAAFGKKLSGKHVIANLVSYDGEVSIVSE